jgi:cytidylate kinase
VAIDGPAASGKSSTSQWVAKRLGIRHVDSGAFYRALTALALRTGDAPERWTEETVLAEATHVTLGLTERSVVPLLDGARHEEELRGTAVTAQVSRVAVMPAVRAWVNARVREAGASTDVVVDGRDIGTTVFPDAPLKVFLVADPWERARRRLVQRLGRKPTDGEIAVETEELVARDARDATQSRPDPSAITIDTTSLTQEEQVERIVALAEAVRGRAPSSHAF